MSNANTIIKENDFDALREKIETLDLLRLMRITKKSINKSRAACFHLIFEYSVKFANRKDCDYQKEYLNPILLQGANNNALYVLEAIVQSPYFDKNKINLYEYFSGYNLHERITLFLKKHFDLSNIDIEPYQCIIRQIKEKDGKLITKNKKNINSFINVWGFDAEDFLLACFEYKKERESYFNKIYDFKIHGLSSFLDIYVESNNIHKFKSLFSKEDEEKYKRNIIKYKIKDF